MSKEKTAKSKNDVLKPKGRAKACAICLVLIVVALFIGGRKSLAPLRSEALDYFYNGDGTEIDVGIESDLEQRITLAEDLITIGERYFDKDEALLTNITYDCSKISGSTEPNVKFKYNEELTSDCYALVEAMDLLDLTDTDTELVVETIVNMESSNEIIGHSSYNQKANEFNSLISEFPTSLVAKISFVKLLSLFEY